MDQDQYKIDTQSAQNRPRSVQNGAKALVNRTGQPVLAAVSAVINTDVVDVGSNTKVDLPISYKMAAFQ